MFRGLLAYFNKCLASFADFEVGFADFVLGLAGFASGFVGFAGFVKECVFASFKNLLKTYETIKIKWICYFLYVFHGASICFVEAFICFPVWIWAGL